MIVEHCPMCNSELLSNRGCTNMDGCGWLRPPPDTIAMVTEFHRAFDYEIPDKPCVPGLDLQASLSLAAIGGRLRDALIATKALLAAHPQKPQCLQRTALILEELIELCEAMATNNILGCLDACEDLEYVVMGTLVALGLAPVHHEAFRRVHASNMSKRKDGKAIKDENGKVVKGDWYEPVDLSDLVV